MDTKGETLNVKRETDKLNKVVEVQECDATEVDGRAKVDNIK